MPKGLSEDREVVIFPGEILGNPCDNPSNVHSPIKVLYLLKNGLWMIVLNLSINFIIESLSVYGAKLHKNGDFYAS